ncbi:MAG: PAS domain S-box protein [Gammaproteobacteria bacterium]|nr:PAS domain S-box protein [Gammaproteobacteria bacterium]
MASMSGSYDLHLVALSYVIAVLSSYAGLALARRVFSTTGAAARVWLLAGAVAMGLGIWIMHFVGMIAYHMPVSPSYDVMLTTLSLVIGIGAAALAIHTASRTQISQLRFLASGVAFGLGISAMHYVGMAAMQVDAVVTYDMATVSASILIAVVAASAAIWLAFAFAHRAFRHRQLLKIVAALIMGLAICGMHYTGMNAVTYELLPSQIMTSGGVGHHLLALTLSVATLFILGMTLLIAFFDVRIAQQHQTRESLTRLVEERTAELEAQASSLKEANLRLQGVLEQREKMESDLYMLGQIIDQSSSEIFVVDAKRSNLLYVNQGVLRNTGFTLDELLTLSASHVNPFVTRAELGKMLDDLDNGRRNEIVMDSAHRRKDGTTYPVQIHMQRISIGEREILAITAQDITERKRLELQLLQSSKLESIGQLAAGIAHEINTPSQFVGDNIRFLRDSFRDLGELYEVHTKLINAIDSGSPTAELVREAQEKSDAADAPYLMEEIPAALEQSLIGISRITNIVRAMKEFSHPGTAQHELLDLNKTISSTIVVATNEWKYSAEMQTDLDANLPPIPGSQQDLAQVVLNLIVNASHAIADSLQGREEEKGTIRISTREDGDMVEIRVTDTGGGIPADIRDRIFDPFFTTKEVGRGTGQGLSIAYRTIVEQHRGTIDVESEVGSGTTFILRLPQKPVRGSTEENDDSMDPAEKAA